VQNLGKNLSTRRDDSAASICRLQRSRAWLGRISRPAGLGKEMTASRPARLPRYAWDKDARRPSWLRAGHLSAASRNSVYLRGQERF
jgi:hypothetical protein